MHDAMESLWSVQFMWDICRESPYPGWPELEAALRGVLPGVQGSSAMSGEDSTVSIERCREELGFLSALYQAGHPDRKGLEMAINDWMLEEVARCERALVDGDAAYLVENLHPRDQWRILDTFHDNLSYFDIETSGLDVESQITFIVCWHKEKLYKFARGENLDDFLADPAPHEEIDVALRPRQAAVQIGRVYSDGFDLSLYEPGRSLRCQSRAVPGVLFDVGDRAVSIPLGIARVQKHYVALPYLFACS